MVPLRELVPGDIADLVAAIYDTPDATEPGRLLRIYSGGRNQIRDVEQDDGAIEEAVLEADRAVVGDEHVAGCHDWRAVRLRHVNHPAGFLDGIHPRSPVDAAAVLRGRVERHRMKFDDHVEPRISQAGDDLLSRRVQRARGGPSRRIQRRHSMRVESKTAPDG